jgi:lysophospholipase L1-like esterase
MLAACTAPPSGSASPAGSEGDHALRYVALGDSYTIGTSVGERERWPNQLVARIAASGRPPVLELVENLGVNGYTSADLVRHDLPRLDELRPEFVTLLIGVNDVVQGAPESAYADNVALILDELSGRLPANRIVCLATPDYTLTPMGGSFGDPDRQRDAIVRVNEILAQACRRRAIAFVPDVFPISQLAKDDATQVAGDGLHPSGAQYARWVDAIQPVVEELLRH